VQAMGEIIKPARTWPMPRPTHRLDTPFWCKIRRLAGLLAHLINKIKHLADCTKME
jgi:hypothetical protein